MILHPVGFYHDPAGSGSDFLSEVVYGREAASGIVGRADDLDSVPAPAAGSSQCSIQIWVEQKGTGPAAGRVATIQIVGTGSFTPLWYDTLSSSASMASDVIIFDLGEMCDTVKITKISDSSSSTGEAETWSITQFAGSFTDGVAFDPGTASTEYGWEYSLAVGDTGGAPSIATGNFEVQFTFIKSGYADRTLNFSGTLTCEAESFA